MSEEKAILKFLEEPITPKGIIASVEEFQDLINAIKTLKSENEEYQKMIK